MLKVFILSLIAVGAIAAPWQPHHHYPRSPPPNDDGPYFRPRDYDLHSLFDTQRFYSDLASDLMNMDRILEQFYQHFPSTTNSEGVEGDDYVIRITLHGYDEDNIVVKAEVGLVMIQAVRKYEDTITQQYLDIRTLPSNVDPNGSWTYDKNVLKLKFSLTKSKDEDTTTTTTEVVPETTENVNRESLENEITSNASKESLDNAEVESTTYAVNPKGDIEFVPIHY